MAAGGLNKSGVGNADCPNYINPAISAPVAAQKEHVNEQRCNYLGLVDQQSWTIQSAPPQQCISITFWQWILGQTGCAGYLLHPVPRPSSHSSWRLLC
eukprot:m.304853 g.304853  ORF g.304853 m.304853 type:complete len:98 (+) comp23012_c3_seq29:4024-4317(+)